MRFERSALKEERIVQAEGSEGVYRHEKRERPGHVALTQTVLVMAGQEWRRAIGAGAVDYLW